ncbi:(4Fe-4S)-binding protein [Tamlana sp. I1]|uniref:(4Fe-4S)-binding protein n=1 Tax=Tamlana sp. I1 TaxID=2762061 RepID=UPI00189004E4|nr:(4Fe-4S)-binding protein [Tamlana sp. I1]
MKTNVKFERNSDITISYDPFVCAQSDICTKSLPEVFRNSVIPWIDLEGESTDKIITQIRKCPSGALKFKINKEELVY